MGNKNLADGLEEMAPVEAVATKEPKEKKEKRELTAEEIKGIEIAAEKLKEMGATPEFSRVLDLAKVWNNKEAAAPVKEAVIEAFGGSEKFKNYVDGAFQEESAVVSGYAKIASTLNNIKAFYGRRATAAKTKMQQIDIDNKIYQINSEFYASLPTTMSRDEKKEALLNHPDTVLNTITEIL